MPATPRMSDAENPLVGTLSLAEVARSLGIGVTTAYELVARDQFPIPVRRIGNRMKVLKHDLDRYLRGEDVRSI
jgi:excisionase family DNA binding protein